MSDSSALQALTDLYSLQKKTFQNFDTACTGGCALCCTQNVLLTGLEGEYLLQALGEQEKAWVEAVFSNGSARLRMQPALTLNAMAALYMTGESPPEYPQDPSAWPCPLLDRETEKCSIYPHRPMACRCMISKINCNTNGFADMEEEAIVLHTLFLQAVEHLDTGGKSANLIDLLMETFHPGSTVILMPKNHKIPVLMIPQSFQKKLRPLFGQISEILRASPKV